MWNEWLLWVLNLSKAEPRTRVADTNTPAKLTYSVIAFFYEGPLVFLFHFTLCFSWIPVNQKRTKPKSRPQIQAHWLQEPNPSHCICSNRRDISRDSAHKYTQSPQPLQKANCILWYSSNPFPILDLPSIFSNVSCFFSVFLLELSCVSYLF